MSSGIKERVEKLAGLGAAQAESLVFEWTKTGVIKKKEFQHLLGLVIMKRNEEMYYDR